MTKAQVLAEIERQLAQLREPDGYYNAGLPNFDHLFGRDACISALQLLHRDPKAARATLRVLAKYQGRHEVLWREEWPGKILHEHFPGGWREQLSNLIFEGDKLRQVFEYVFWRFPYYGSVDVGAWYLILLHHYARATGDEALVRKLWPTAMGIVGWLEKHATHSHTGLVGFRRHYVFGLRNQSWKDNITTNIAAPVAMVEVQGYYFYAFNLLAELAEDVMRDAATAGQLRARAARLQTEFHNCFVPQNGTYPLAVDGRGRAIMVAASNPGHLLFTGILDKHEADAVVARLMQPDLLTPYGVRTESMHEATFNAKSYQNGSVWPFDNWVIAQGMAKTGHAAEAKKLAGGMVEVFEAWQNLPELYEVTAAGDIHGIKKACRIQAWSAGALINVLDEAPVM